MALPFRCSSRVLYFSLINVTLSGLPLKTHQRLAVSPFISSILSSVKGHQFRSTSSQRLPQTTGTYTALDGGVHDSIKLDRRGAARAANVAKQVLHLKGDARVAFMPTRQRLSSRSIGALQCCLQRSPVAFFEPAKRSTLICLLFSPLQIAPDHVGCRNGCETVKKAAIEVP